MFYEILCMGYILMLVTVIVTIANNNNNSSNVWEQNNKKSAKNSNVRIILQNKKSYQCIMHYYFLNFCCESNKLILWVCVCVCVNFLCFYWIFLCPKKQESVTQEMRKCDVTCNLFIDKLLFLFKKQSQ